VLSSNRLSYHPVTVKNEGSNPFNIAISTKGKTMENIISFQELRDTFKRVAILAGFTERWFDSLVDSHGLPFLSSYVIVQLWKNKTPDNVDTEMVRYQLKELEKHGCFNVIKY
jgi:hypothetical protein